MSIVTSQFPELSVRLVRHDMGWVRKNAKRATKWLLGWAVMFWILTAFAHCCTVLGAEGFQPATTYSHASTHGDENGCDHDDSEPAHSGCHVYSPDNAVIQEFALPSESSRGIGFLIPAAFTSQISISSINPPAARVSWRPWPPPRSYPTYHRRTARLLI